MDDPDIISKMFTVACSLHLYDRPTQSSYTVYKESPNSTASQNFLGSLANAGIIIGQIVIVTIIIVVLFKRGHIKVQRAIACAATTRAYF